MNVALINAIEPFATEVHLEAGEAVIIEGQPQDAWYIVLHGRLSVSQAIRGDMESVLAELGPGATFGELAVFHPGPASATVSAEERSVLWRVDRAGMEQIASDPDMAWELLGSMAGKVRMANARLAEVVTWSLDSAAAESGEPV